MSFQAGVWDFNPMAERNSIYVVLFSKAEVSTDWNMEEVDGLGFGICGGRGSALSSASISADQAG
jgi:hypothetical protein